jgi:DNA polymerase-3 subunit epsilon
VTRSDRSLLTTRVAVAAAAAAVLLLFTGLGALLLWGSLGAEERPALQAVQALLAERGPLLAAVALGVVLAAAGAAGPLHRRWVAAPAQLAEQAEVLLGPEVQRRVTLPEGAAPLQALAAHVNALAAQRDALRADMAGEVARASQHIEQERQRLAALMSELPQSVVVCTLEGRVLLYNRRARLQFRALSGTPGAAGGAELLGLGRSIHAVFDRELVAHALASVQQRLQRGAEQPSAQFITSTPSGQLLRVRLSPVRAVEAAGLQPRGAAPLAGFVLLLDNVTREFEADSENTRWPLEDMRGSDVLQAAQARIQAGGRLACTLGAVDETLWLRVDSYSLLLALAGLAERVHDELGLRSVQLRLHLAPEIEGAGPRRAQLDLLWTGPALSTETAMGWELDALPRSGAAARPGGPPSLSVREVVQRHGGGFWFERERTRHEAFFRFVLPLAAETALLETLEAADASADASADSRPDYLGFDLFAASQHQRALDDRPLAELSYTVFDTETTGLDPATDEILQIGATRLIAGRLLKGESFEQLVNPGRSIPAEGIAIHGITPAMVAGQPPITTVLPAFHAYARDTVLVAHNAAFDLRFFQLKEAATGLRFEQPVLDTLLLSAVVHPAQTSHRLEAIAERFGVSVQGRHTALGDALVTAEIFRRMLPLLAQQGIVTLGQARAAAQKTWYAQLRY